MQMLELSAKRESSFHYEVMFPTSARLRIDSEQHMYRSVYVGQRNVAYSMLTMDCMWTMTVLNKKR